MQLSNSTSDVVFGTDSTYLIEVSFPQYSVGRGNEQLYYLYHW